MARPKKINPKGETRAAAALIPEPLARELEREAKREGVTMAEIMRKRLSRAA